MARRYKYDEVVKIIEDKGCKLVSQEYKNNQTKMEVLCSCKQHTFWVNLNAFINGKVICDECMVAKSGKKIWNIDMIRKYAESKGVILLSNEYKNFKTKLSFKCKTCGKPYETDLDTFMQTKKYTCNACSRKRAGEMKQFSYDEVKKVIEELGSELLSEEYIDSQTLLKVRCTDCGEPIYVSFANINHRKTIRCVECGYKYRSETYRFTIDEVREIIESDESGCKLLSTEYKGYREELKILCGCGKNVINTTLELFQMRSKKYCPDCGGQIKWDLNLAKKYVLENSDCELLADEYISTKTKMPFKCGCGNLFYTDISTFIYKDKHQCNQCSSEHSMLQLKCHDFLESNNIEYLSEKTFEDCINPLTNVRLRYDFYLPNYKEKGLLIEAMGIQHEKPIRFYNAITEEEAIIKFEQQKYRDELKRKYAEDNGIELLYIWYYELDNIPEILTTKLKLN